MNRLMNFSHRSHNGISQFAGKVRMMGPWEGLGVGGAGRGADYAVRAEMCSTVRPDLGRLGADLVGSIEPNPGCKPSS